MVAQGHVVVLVLDEVNRVLLTLAVVVAVVLTRLLQEKLVVTVVQVSFSLLGHTIKVMTPLSSLTVQGTF